MSDATAMFSGGPDSKIEITKSTVNVVSGTKASVISSNPNLGRDDTPTHRTGTSDDAGYSLLFDDIFTRDGKPLKFGTRVFEGYQKHATGRKIPVAIKLIAPFSNKNLREVKHLVTITPHSHVVRIFRSKKCKGHACPELFIVMELCQRETLTDYYNKTPPDLKEIMSYSKQFLKGIKHIHQNNIIHGDLKPDNILFSSDDKKLKVSDFGISKQLAEGKSKTERTSLGTDCYRAPETENSDVISKKADIYSSAIVLFGMFTNGKHPFGKRHAQHYNMVEDNKPELHALPKEMGELKRTQLCNLLLRMLKFKPEERPTIEEVLNDEFFTPEVASEETSTASPASTSIPFGENEDPATEDLTSSQEDTATEDTGSDIRSKRFDNNEEFHDPIRPAYKLHFCSKLNVEQRPPNRRPWRIQHNFFVIVAFLVAVAIGLLTNGSEKEGAFKLETATDKSSQGWKTKTTAGRPRQNRKRNLQSCVEKGLASVTVQHKDFLQRKKGFYGDLKNGCAVCIGDWPGKDFAESIKFEINGRTKSLADLATLHYPIPGCDPVLLVLWFATDTSEYVATNSNSDTVVLSRSAVIPIKNGTVAYCLPTVSKAMITLIIFSPSDVGPTPLSDINVHGTAISVIRL